MNLSDDDLSSQDWDILDLLLKVGANPMPSERIAKELDMGKTSGDLQLALLSLSGRGWLQPEGDGSYIDWKLTDEGREELQRRSTAK